jgi:hypothetical protein
VPDTQWLELEKFKRITPVIMKAIAVMRAIETGSLKTIIPRIAVPAAPMPVHTAYAVPIGRTLSDQASKEKLPDANTKNPMLGHTFVKLLESFNIVAKPTSSNPAVITANHAMRKLYQIRRRVAL